MELTKAQRFRVKIACLFKRQQGKRFKTPPAMHAVLNTTELLETILLHLSPNRDDHQNQRCNDMVTLLLSQRVCKAFQGTIRGSVHLQRALFFQPSDPTYAAAHSIPDVNPLVFLRNYAPGDRVSRHRRGEISGIFYCIVFDETEEMAVLTLDCDPPRWWLLLLDQRLKPGRTHASWNRMLLFQPGTSEKLRTVQVWHLKMRTRKTRYGRRLSSKDELSSAIVVPGGEMASVVLVRVAALVILLP
ncbi:hypothetical protein LTR10_007588 [Elasticomyces elasticus]|nr:hypothetical protein LTR10_007588 [Elasticomyces elasticus]KAK4970592.1 hypothetical protein LTR42_007567 [Elasticomyces elasticus]